MSGKIKYSDFFGCYFCIYLDPVTNKITTERKETKAEADAFFKENNSEEDSVPEQWWQK